MNSGTAGSEKNRNSIDDQPTELASNRRPKGYQPTDPEKRGGLLILEVASRKWREKVPGRTRKWIRPD